MMVKIFNNNKVPAFTLIEMLVSIGVITLISSLFVANYRTGNQRTDLSMAAQSLAADLRQAQNNTLALTTYGGSLPDSGWGIHVQTATSSYILFADLQAAPDSNATRYNSELEGNINSGARTTQLSPGIIVSDLQLINRKNNSNNSVNEVDITFLPPDPRTTINAYNVGTSTEVRIILKETAKNTTKTIEVNVFGLIEVID